MRKILDINQGKMEVAPSEKKRLEKKRKQEEGRKEALGKIEEKEKG